MTDEIVGPGLGVARMHFPITALGFGQRIGIWVQGCSIGCRGCMSLDTWSREGSLTSINAVVEKLAPWLDEADGVSISGGEPLQQISAVALLLETIRSKLRGDIILFTGYAEDCLPPGSDAILNLIDTLVAGPFDATHPDTRALSGSSNQVIRFLTPLGQSRYEDFAEASRSHPSVDLISEAGGFWLAGVPRPGELERLGTHLAKQGIVLKTSAGLLGSRT